MSKFDWHRDSISSDTVITKSYKNTQNVRRFFKKKCGEEFKFNRSYMQWIKEDAQGLTMGDAVQEWSDRNK